MASKEFDIPELQDHIDIPPVMPGTLAHLKSYVAGPQFQSPLGFPGELVDNWQEKAIDKMGELLGKYRSLQVFLVPA